MNVLGHRRVSQTSSEDSLIAKIYKSEELLEMLSRCDYVVVTVPLPERTRGLIGDTEFAVMKKNAVVINVGRGPTVEERAMIKALSQRRIRGAALDVFDQEPLPQGILFTLWRMSCCPLTALTTPRLAGQRHAILS
jgi:phosphoglycerate dehydrogenase-like enzyme